MRLWAAAILSAVISSSAYADNNGGADTVKANSFRQYWHNLVYGNVDRTFDRKMDLTLALMRKNLDCWGVSYEGCSVNPVSGYTRQQICLDADYRYRLLPKFYAGAALNINSPGALNVKAPEYPMDAQGGTGQRFRQF
jgi:bacterial surface antigen